MSDAERMVTVRYYTCSCEWTSKYCDEEHTATARVPLWVLANYTN